MPARAKDFKKFGGYPWEGGSNFLETFVAWQGNKPLKMNRNKILGNEAAFIYRL